MKLFLISQDQNNDYDTYDSAVVVAPDEETARNMDPSNGQPMDRWECWWNTWCDDPNLVSVRYLGEAADGVTQGVVCASFNAA